jgi:hypothetical protein
MIYKSDQELLKYYRNCENYHKPDPPIQKRTIYFVIDSLLANIEQTHTYYSLSIDFPIDFIQTSNPRFVHVKNAKYYYLEDPPVSEPKEVFVCSDIIQSERYADSFLCCCNDSEQYKILQIFDAKTAFNLWIKDEKGYLLPLNKNKCRCFIELLLEF